ncbi:MAG: hypothetical protein LLF86_00385 [Nitrospiraceae bacterium]|nr:hypothetical protein [Nitrospiraceae bacterium]
MKLSIYLLPLVLIAFSIPFASYADTANITVMVKSKDAKFIGDSMGGAKITIKDINSGTILAQGVTKGSTGNTDIIMGTHKRGAPLSDSSSAKFTASINITKPVHVEITATGPLHYPASMQTATVTHWLIPGKDITAGDAITIELPGFVVQTLIPADSSVIKTKNNAAVINIEAKVLML